MELAEALRRRKMTRAFLDQAVPATVLERVLDAGLRAPSAGHTQALELLVLEASAERDLFWRAEVDPGWAAEHPDFVQHRLEPMMRAPLVILPLTGPDPYLTRYSEPDKLGVGRATTDRWRVPFWWFDAGAAVMAMLLVAAEVGLAALFRDVQARPALWESFRIPESLSPAGALLLGWPAPDAPSRSLQRGRRPLQDVVHRGRYH